MKRIFLSLTFIFFIILIGISQDLPSYVPTDGLVAYYPFNGNANDESGNGYHGTVNGATLTADRLENNEKAYSYNGKDTFITLSNNFFDGADNGTYTINFWTKNFQENSRIFYKGGSWKDLIIDINSENKVQYSFINGTNSTWNHLTSNNSLEQDKWYNITIRHEIGEINLYLNGTFEAQLQTNDVVDWSTSINTPCAGIGMHFGKNYNNCTVDVGYHGVIDDFGIWDRALSEQEIQNLYTSSTVDILLNGIVSAENNQIKNVANPTESLDAVNLGFLTEKLNELRQKINELESLIDSSQEQLPSEYVLSFDANNYVRFPNIDNYDNLDSMTIEFWAYLNSSPCTDESIIGTEYFATGWHFYPGMWAMIGGPNNAEAMSNVDAHGSCENYIESSKWFHIALQYNSELNENQWKLYIDGDLHEQKTGNISSIGDGGDIVINRHTWDSGSSSRLSGYIDEVRFSKIARYSGNFTPEIKQLQNDENTLLLLNFENTTSNQVIDSSNNQNHGIISGTVNYVLRNEIENSNAAN